MHILVGVVVVAGLIWFVAGTVAARVFIGLILIAGAAVALLIVFAAICDGCLASKPPADSPTWAAGSTSYEECIHNERAHNCERFRQ